MELQHKLKEIIELFTDKEINTNSHFIDDLDFDSLTVVEFIMKLEDEYGIEINDEETSKIFKVEDAQTLLNSKVQ
jgi:acyl carrier protein|tara:strand:+ start:604 stop:828 length:225 start_codon:yes stop_codon:yes gene_type:complete